MKRCLVFCVFLFLLGGCAVKNGKTGETMYRYGVPTASRNEYPYQPIVKPPDSVISVIQLQAISPIWPESTKSWMEWKSGFMSVWNSDKVVDKCLNFLKNSSSEYHLKDYKMSYMDIPVDIRYPWMWPSEIIVWGGGYYKNDGIIFEPTREISVYKKINTIVCLQPLVVIQSDGIIVNRLSCGNAIRHIGAPYNNEIENLFENSTKCYVLKNGFAYGTKIPYSKEIQWFSPDMKITPRPITFDTNDVGGILVPWGELLLNKQGDEWVVSANLCKN